VGNREHFCDLQFRPVKLASSDFEPLGLALGNGASPLEVVVATTTAEPRIADVRAAWKKRRAGRAAPLMLVVLYDNRATLCGPTGEDPPAYPNVDIGQAERICREALEQPSRHTALKALETTLKFCDAREYPLSGITNNGFLATHELARGIRAERWAQAWGAAEHKSRPLLAERGDPLLRKLGFHIEKVDQVTSLLRVGTDGKRVAVAVLLHQSESPELQADRFGGLSPVSYALAVADRENLPYVIVSQGSKLRLYPVKVGVGVGRRGRTETYVEVHTGLLRDTDAGYLWMLFSAEALVTGGTLDELLAESKRYAGDLAERLRERIYGEVVPRLAEALAAARGLKKPTAKDLSETYEMTMTVLFRLLFIAYAEDKDLLPYKHNETYRENSLKHKAQELLRLRGTNTPFDTSATHWNSVRELFEAVEKGKGEWGVPEYDGGLFASAADASRVGHLLTKVTLSNRDFGPVLLALLTIEVPGEGWGPVDFRSLGVREFGTIYEGLLESELSVAATDLTYDETGKEKGVYRPCKKGEEPKVAKSRIYLHDKSGARKSTGAYFTKEFAVEHLLNHALEPALREHFERLDKLDDDDAAESFFDFRGADIAMGSGHFLVSAVDHIEQGFTQYLSRRPLSGVRGELAKLRGSAAEALGAIAEQVEIEDTQLLRRFIARRCIYGVDLNPVSVALARVSIWIHTFVPGLPLSLLDHNLTCGNSLVGIGSVDEIRVLAEAQKASASLFLQGFDPQALVGEATEPLRKLARIADATAAEVKRARKAMQDARAKTAPAEALCDIVTACRMNKADLPIDLDQWEKVKATIVDSHHHKEARKTLAELSPLHFPIAFPEVFLRERSGFDVILGNPPWETSVVHEVAFWARHFPGLRGLTQRVTTESLAALQREHADLIALYERERNEAQSLRVALLSGGYPDMGEGDPDLHRAFCWRFLRLSEDNSGHVGVVLPTGVFNVLGTKEFRQHVLRSCRVITLALLINNRQWVFDEVHPQYNVALSAFRQGGRSYAEVGLWGPARSLAEYKARVARPPLRISARDIFTWNDIAALPLLPDANSLDVFLRMRDFESLGADVSCGWRARPYAEAHSGKCRSYLSSVPDATGLWPVYKGHSFDLDGCGEAEVYGYASPTAMAAWLDAVRAKQVRGSAYAEFSREWAHDTASAPWLSYRIAYRDVARSTDSRTIVVAVVPPRVFLADTAPYLLFSRGTIDEQAFVYAVLRSIPLDWYARRFVEKHVKFYIIGSLPIPRPPEHDPLRKRAVALAGRLAAVDDRYADWAAAVGVECGPVTDKLKFDMICELDAVVALLYGLDEKHLRHIFETFHEGWGPGQTATHPTLGEFDVRLATTMGYYTTWKRAP